MKRNIAAVVVVLFGLGVTGAAFAQTRHDEKPHDYDKAKAEATVPNTTSAMTASGSGGRHDEKPHGVKKATTTSKSTPKAGDARSTAAPATALGAGEAGQ